MSSTKFIGRVTAAGSLEVSTVCANTAEHENTNPQRPAAVNREASSYTRRTLVLKLIDKWQEMQQDQIEKSENFIKK